MKKIIVLTFLVIIVSCKKESSQTFNKSKGKSPEVMGKALFEGEGNCIACHKIDQKIIGPSLQEIAKSYKSKKGSIVSFLQEQSEPIVDPKQYDIMKTNFAITKSMTEEELKALEAYILKQ